MKEYGRGNRARRQVNYSDDLTDAQFLKLCQDDEVESEEHESELVAVPTMKKGKGKKNKNQNQNLMEEEEEYKG